MIRSTASKVMWVGRATALPVVLAVMLVLVFGTTPASAHGGYKGVLHLGHSKAVAKVTTLVGKVAKGPALVVNNPSGGSALGLQVSPGQAPLTVNVDAGKATNLDADKLDGKEASNFLGKMEKAADSDTLDGINSSGFYQAGSKAADSDKLDGKDSDEILPLLRAQRDSLPGATSSVQTGNSATLNTVSITAPTDGFFVISSSVDIIHYSGTDTQKFTVFTKLDSTSVGAARLEISPNSGESVSPHTTVPASAGQQHTITLEASRFSGTGSWYFNRNNLSVTFVPASRGAVTEVPFGG